MAGGVYYMMRADAPESVSAQRRGAGMGGPVAVIAKTADKADVPVYFEGVGSVKALNTATVRAQVDGRLLSVNFKEGQDVKRGDVLAKIDPITYQAQLDQAIAKKALDEALLANSRKDLERYKRVGTLAISQQQIDTQTALIAQQEAQVKSDTAAIENAAAILSYTTIVAPFDGRTGIRLVDEGNLVRAGEAGGIVVITQVQPITVVFTLPQQLLPTLAKSSAEGVLTAYALSTDGQDELDAGKLTVIDNQVDQQTGTIRLKAEFPNAKRQLWPGQFVNVRLLVDTLKAVTVAPTESVQRGPDGTYVYVVGADNTVELRHIKISRQDEKHAVIAEGLTAGEKVVTSGFGRLKDGATVSVSDGNTSQPKGPAISRKSAEGRNARASDTQSSGGVQAAQASARAATEAALVTGATADTSKVSGKNDRSRREDGASR